MFYLASHQLKSNLIKGYNFSKSSYCEEYVKKQKISITAATIAVVIAGVLGAYFSSAKHCDYNTDNSGRARKIRCIRRGAAICSDQSNVFL
ncbi:hypothetical protein NITUZ_140189 [Candidatus Nitrosotenuis uzonensis]|uniref:Uncharacterized protein n=1 Tax=Candidatus Nitrosotenuis uzonensis TaxID=1407055 RepID=V6ARA8_9ARCH|nr:hypothetical protein NITUZ_140189 [Candidatus Nitrosotenuis uzonensis]